MVGEVEAAGFTHDTEIGRVSLVGGGMKTHPGVAAEMFEVLAAEGVNIEMISTSTIRISCVVQEADVERAVRALHRAFELDPRVSVGWDRSMSVGVVGATGLVGQEMLRVLEERAFPVAELRAYASPRSEGRRTRRSPAARSSCEVLRDGCFDGLDLVVIDVDDPLAAEWAPRAAAAGATVIDNSAAFRMDPDVPLVVAEVNPDDLHDMPQGHRLVPELHDDGARHRARAAAPRRGDRADGRLDLPGGLGRRAARHRRARRAVDRGRRARRTPAARRARRRARSSPARSGTARSPGNVIPLAGSVREAGYTSEEWKLVHESRKILHAPDLRVSGTCVRVPVYVGHSMAANVQFPRPLTPRRGRERSSPTRPASCSSTAATASRPRSRARASTRCSSGACARTRRRTNTLDLWVTGDNLRKGAALNAVQLAELIAAG